MSLAMFIYDTSQKACAMHTRGKVNNM